MTYLHHFVFGVYPYIGLAIFLFGSLVRFEREQYTWKSDSSQLIDRRLLRAGSYLFHIGVLGVFAGHLVGLLTPLAVWDALGVSHGAKQLLAMVAGGIFGGMGLIGALILIYRRFSSERLRAITTWRDKLTLGWITVTLILGLSTIFVSKDHLDGHMMTLFMEWAQRIVTFRGDAANYIVDAPGIFKLHIFMGMTLFVIFPFTRLVHVWSGFGAAGYVTRAWQLVRPRG
ncbi:MULTISPECIES: respiratory nitrate reductase subunit gamma [Jeongeupia]|uniref:Respiratory nitrate reductase subunit gamma n=1 Tax=Jeongeupia naejangsanensis TaxID=613195 RepID=A0ABS2BJY5_9NEIS|nr:MULTISPECIES: respiratory nitrate reductase subunit gamma [Jeongeupia]MBM3115903.1 respiratory nitrate reductase subunit gamma [Jeongeupia naejangsanensis]